MGSVVRTSLGLAFVLLSVEACVIEQTQVAPPPTPSATAPTAYPTAPATAPPNGLPTAAPTAPPPAPTKACASDADCGQGTTCQGAEGCNAAWTCQPAKLCTFDLRAFCGCDGKTFQGSGSCPSKPYSKVGACEPAPPAPPKGPKTCTSGADCAANEQCAGGEGCGTPWTCQPQKPCTRDLVTFCGCDGKQFQGSGSCPGKPFSKKGKCDAGAKP
jgi:hypothetical protein